MEWAEYKDTENQAEVLRQLVELGYDISQRTFYRHCKQGKCRRNPKNNTFSRRLVKQYVESEGIRRSGQAATDENGPDVALSIEKQRLENKKLEIDNETRAVKLARITGKLIDREALYLELAARAVTIDNGFRQKIEMTVPELIAIVKGDGSRQVEFLDMLMQAWDELLNSYATTAEFEVLFDEEDDIAIDLDQDEAEEIDP